MIELLVMRHAKSDWSAGEADFDRPLNERGTQAAAKMAAWLADEGLQPDCIVSSSAARTRATALAVAKACDVDLTMVEFDADLYLADAFTWMQKLTKQVEGRVLICGHNPGLDYLVDGLSSAPAPLSVSGKLMTTAAIAHFRFDVQWSDIAAGTGQLVQLVRPR